MRPQPINTKDLLAALKTLKPTTREWFSTARNYAIYSNQGGIYDEVPMQKDAVQDWTRQCIDEGWDACKTARFFGDFYGDTAGYLSLADLAEGARRFEWVRQAVGDQLEVGLDLHCAFDVPSAIRLAKRLEPYDPLWLEEPVPPENVDEMARVAAQTSIPIATGERLYTKFPFAEIIEHHAADVLQPDIANAGGITELKKIAIIAESKHITMAPHNVCSPVGAMAEMHLDASIVNFEIQEYHAEFYTDHYFTVTRGFERQQDGYVTLGDAPGLGLELDDEVIAAHPPLEKVHARGGSVKGI